jgi:hypothetical protein
MSHTLAPCCCWHVADGGLTLLAWGAPHVQGVLPALDHDAKNVLGFRVSGLLPEHGPSPPAASAQAVSGADDQTANSTNPSAPLPSRPTAAEHRCRSFVLPILRRQYNDLFECGLTPWQPKVFINQPCSQHARKDSGLAVLHAALCTWLHELQAGATSARAAWDDEGVKTYTTCWAAGPALQASAQFVLGGYCCWALRDWEMRFVA